MPSMVTSSGTWQAAATTGPAKGPRPASSAPTTNLHPARFTAASSCARVAPNADAVVALGVAVAAAAAAAAAAPAAAAATPLPPPARDAALVDAAGVAAFPPTPAAGATAATFFARPAAAEPVDLLPGGVATTIEDIARCGFAAGGGILAAAESSKPGRAGGRRRRFGYRASIAAAATAPALRFRKADPGDAAAALAPGMRPRIRWTEGHTQQPPRPAARATSHRASSSTGSAARASVDHPLVDCFLLFKAGLPLSQS